MSLRQLLFGSTGSKAVTPATRYQVIEQTYQIVVNVDANKPTNSTITGKITIDPRYDPVTQLPVNKGEIWYIEDIYVTSTPSVDGIVRLIKNGREVIHITPPISALLVSNPSRPVSKPAEPLREFETLSVEFINFTSPSSAQTVTIYMKVKRLVPIG